MMDYVVTIGYQDRTVDELVGALKSAGVKTLVDVRLTPMSRKPGLSKRRLAGRLTEAGIDYLHLPQLGNPRDNRDALRRGDADSVARYRAVLETPESRAALHQIRQLQHVALMCFERNPSECHRSLIVERLVETDPRLTVEHL
jgi:uncharacterized protein (DUF488 family)